MHKKTGDNEMDLLFQKSLKFSMLDGAFFALMLGIGEYYLSAYIISLGANNLEIGLIGTLPIFIASIFQVFGPNLITYFNSRKKALFIPSLIRTIIWIPIIFAWSFGASKIWLIIIATIIYFTTNFLGTVPWVSWMGDLLDEVERPNYFAIRNKIASLITFIGIILGGVILELTKQNPITGFIIIFTVSFVSSLISTYFIYKKTDIPFIETQEDIFSLKTFTKNLTTDLFGKFTIFNSVFNMAVYIAAPFFAAYQLNVLKISYIEYMIGIAALITAKFLFFKPIASYTQKHGNVKVLSLSLILITIVPIWWIFITQPWEIYLANFISGMGWAGYELLSFNFVYDTIKPVQRSRSISYMTFYKGIGIFIGGVVGSFLIKIFHELFVLIFLISGIARVLSLLYFSKEIKELNDVEPISHQKLFLRIISTVPREGIYRTLVGIKTAKNKIKLIKPIQFKKKLE